MHSYRLKAAENYKDAFKLIYAIKMDCFNSHLYFYYVNNRINPLTVLIDPSRVPLIAEKKVIQSCLKNYRTGLNRQEDVREPYYLKVASLILLILLNQAGRSSLIQPGRSLLIHHLRLTVRVRSVCNYLLRPYFKDSKE